MPSTRGSRSKITLHPCERQASLPRAAARGASSSSAEATAGKQLGFRPCASTLRSVRGGFRRLGNGDFDGKVEPQGCWSWEEEVEAWEDVTAKELLWYGGCYWLFSTSAGDAALPGQFKWGVKKQVMMGKGVLEVFKVKRSKPQFQGRFQSASPRYPAEGLSAPVPRVVPTPPPVLGASLFNNPFTGARGAARAPIDRVCLRDRCFSASAFMRESAD